MTEAERLRAALQKCSDVALKELEFTSKKLSEEGESDYREGAADAACDILNEINHIIRKVGA